MPIRITGGAFGGRLLDVPRKGVRPTQDRVRAAVFSSLLGLIPESRVLDLFAGTGAFGLEALSRGAAFACFVETDRSVASCLKANIMRLLPANPKMPNNSAGLVERQLDSQWQIINTDVSRFLESCPVESQFDIIFADPPYDSQGKWAKKILSHLSRRFILKEKGYLIIELNAKSPLIEESGWSMYHEKLYGETKICFYQQKRETDIS